MLQITLITSSMNLVIMFLQVVVPDVLLVRVIPVKLGNC